MCVYVYVYVCMRLCVCREEGIIMCRGKHSAWSGKVVVLVVAAAGECPFFRTRLFLCPAPLPSWCRELAWQGMWELSPVFMCFISFSLSLSLSLSPLPGQFPT